MPELRVGIDVSPLKQTRAGTARYLSSLIAELEREGVDISRYSFGGKGRASVPARDIGWYLAGLPRRARRDAVDVLHCPTFRAPTRSAVPLVVTVHDLAVLRYPYAFNRWTRTYSERLLPKVVEAADRLVAVSEFTRTELEALLDVPADRVRVVPNGVGEPFRPDGPGAEGDYVLSVSTLEPRKNLPRLVQAFEKASLPGIELRVVGAVGWGGVNVRGRNVKLLGEVPDEELARLYRGARCVAYVSLYEGFGLPVLEAMACGAPVVVARGGAPEEVAGSASVSVDGLDEDSIGAGIVEAIERSQELRDAGSERAAGFTWRRTALETRAVYEEVAP